MEGLQIFFLVSAFLGGLLVGWMIGLMLGESKRKALEKALAEKNVVPDLAITHQNEVYDLHVTRYDVEKKMFVGIEGYTHDLIEEIHENKELRHLMRLVILGFDLHGDSIGEYPQLRKHFGEIHDHVPYLAAFLEPKDCFRYVRVVYEAKCESGEIAGKDEAERVDKFRMMIIGHISALVAEKYTEMTEEERSTLLEKLLNRVEHALDRLENEKAPPPPPPPELAGAGAAQKPAKKSFFGKK